jgi:hypothetical protein
MNREGGVTALAAAVLLVLGLGQYALQDRLRLTDAAFVEPPPEQEAKWDPQLFRAITFGQLGTGIDLLWLRTLVDPSIAHVAPGRHARAYYDLDLATDLDPAFFELYNLGSYVLSIIRDDNEGARDLLLKGRAFHRERLAGYPASFGERFWSRAWSLYITLAYVQLFELEDMPGASRTFGEAAEIPGAPVYLRSLKARLDRPGGQYEVALRLLSHLLENAPDDEARARLAEKRRSLLVVQFLSTVRDRLAEFAGVTPGAAIARTRLEERWRQFLRRGLAPERDPWGGRLSLDVSGKVVTTTPHERVFGLE